MHIFTTTTIQAVQAMQWNSEIVRVSQSWEKGLFAGWLDSWIAGLVGSFSWCYRGRNLCHPIPEILLTCEKMVLYERYDGERERKKKNINAREGKGFRKWSRKVVKIGCCEISSYQICSYQMLWQKVLNCFKNIVARNLANYLFCIC